MRTNLKLKNTGLLCCWLDAGSAQVLTQPGDRTERVGAVKAFDGQNFPLGWIPWHQDLEPEPGVPNLRLVLPLPLTFLHLSCLLLCC